MAIVELEIDSDASICSFFFDALGCEFMDDGSFKSRQRGFGPEVTSLNEALIFLLGLGINWNDCIS